MILFQITPVLQNMGFSRIQSSRYAGNRSIFLWACWFLAKNPFNFVPLHWKHDNPYCHAVHLAKSGIVNRPQKRGSTEKMAMITLGTALSHDDNICAATGKDWYTAYPRKILPNYVHHRQLWQQLALWVKVERKWQVIGFLTMIIFSNGSSTKKWIDTACLRNIVTKLCNGRLWWQSWP